MDRAEAIEVLNFYRNCHYTEPLGTEERELADAINEILPHYAALREQEQSKWISVKERLPEDEVDVLVRCYYNANWCLQVCHISGWMKGRWYTSVAGQYVEVSHWMPLPEPPKEGADHA